MRLGYVGETSIECSPLLLLLVVWLAISGTLAACLTVLLALSLHELAHALMARGLGFRVERIELQPFGFVARIERAVGWDALAVSAAGPLFSLLTAMGCAAAGAKWTLPFVAAFGKANLSIALVNLLPVLPLDGGRMLRVFLSRFFSEDTCLNLGAAMGMLAGGGLLVLGIALLLRGERNATAAIFGLFLFLAALRERREGGHARMDAMLRRHKALRRGESIRVVHIGVHKSMSVSAALRRMQGGAYTVIDVLDDDMRMIGRAEEARLLAFLARSGGNIPIGEAMRIDRGPKG
ncbi:MAG: site-2 protease family protein [Candidatus Pelethousia sp.]|nr:site-2 protease family protein [Candidatus Pelethousia sp.]